ncbi:hypothetical protein ACTMU2_29065 [Cupriavidus basilensis]
MDDEEALTVSDGVNRVLDELGRLGARPGSIIISTNVAVRLDGLPRSGQREPADPGAAVYWQDRSGAPRVMAIDQYRSVADNLAAIAATLEAMRAIERHGGAQILERAFTASRPFVSGRSTQLARDHRRAGRRAGSECSPDSVPRARTGRAP